MWLSFILDRTVRDLGAAFNWWRGSCGDVFALWIYPCYYLCKFWTRKSQLFCVSFVFRLVILGVTYVRESCIKDLRRSEIFPKAWKWMKRCQNSRPQIGIWRRWFLVELRKISVGSLEFPKMRFRLFPGACLSKVPRTFRAREASCQIAIPLFWKADLLTCFNVRKTKWSGDC